MISRLRLGADRLCVDDSEIPRWAALFSGSHLIEFWSDPPHSYLGEHHNARIAQCHIQHRRATAIIEDGTSVSFQIPDGLALKSGQIVPLTITADARSDKPVQAVFGRQLAGRYVIINLDAGGGSVLRLSQKQTETLSDIQKHTFVTQLPSVPDGTCFIIRRVGFDALVSNQSLPQDEATALLSHWRIHSISSNGTAPQCLYRGRSFVEQMQLYYPSIKTILVDRVDRNEAELQAEAGLSEKHICENGALLWIETTRTAVMIDIDSARSKRAPAELAIEVLPEIIAALRLRQLSGRVIVDIPRVSRRRQKNIEEALRQHAASDPRHPDIIGFTASGLLELKIRHGRKPLAEMLQAHAKVT